MTYELNHHNHRTYKLGEHYPGKAKNVMGQPGGIETWIGKGDQGDVKHVRKAARA